MPSGNAAAALNLADDGPDACFKAARTAFGGDTKIASLSSSFGIPENLQKFVVTSTPVGDLKSCSLQFQDPENANKLLRADMDVKTGEFKKPQPMELMVVGDAASFKLDNIVLPLSQIDTSKIAPVIDGQKAKLEDIFSSHALTSVSLMGLSPGRDKHVVSIDFAGRLKSNDIIDTGGIGLTVDGGVEYNNIGN
ncbi:MAG TPA: hypothetical protein VLA50_12720 [Erythrobacter sp.]|nr:hypothetical protein [Erythrobacter sp.]